MIIAGLTWVLSYTFVVPMNPEWGYHGTRLASNADQCVEVAKGIWHEHYDRNFPDWVQGSFTAVCTDKKNYSHFRTITCDKAMNCEVKG